MTRQSGNSERPLFGDERSLMVVDLVMIRITVNEGCTIELKKALYKAIAEGLQTLVGLKPQDVFISLVEVKKENWSFENSVAQHAP
jgi:phenylpyruvate tautomerase PptA (4-oxalocrotonate tautomerase family)